MMTSKPSDLVGPGLGPTMRRVMGLWPMLVAIAMALITVGHSEAVLASDTARIDEMNRNGTAAEQKAEADIIGRLSAMQQNAADQRDVLAHMQLQVDRIEQIEMRDRPRR